MYQLHKWPGIVFLIPGLLVALTTFLLAVDKPLELDKVYLSSKAAPGYDPEIRAMAQIGTMSYIGCKSGVFKVQNGQTVPVKELSGVEVRQMLHLSDTLLVVTKQGIWMLAPRIYKVYPYEAWSVSRWDREHLMVGLGKKGLAVIDFEGKKADWQLPSTTHKQLLGYASAEPVTLHKLVMDLHTGEAFMGKNLRWIYMVLCSIMLLALVITGAWFVFRKKKKKNIIIK